MATLVSIIFVLLHNLNPNFCYPVVYTSNIEEHMIDIAKKNAFETSFYKYDPDYVKIYETEEYKTAINTKNRNGWYVSKNEEYFPVFSVDFSKNDEIRQVYLSAEINSCGKIVKTERALGLKK